MLSPDQLLKVANAYAQASGLSLVTVGRAACNNDKIFRRLSEGGGATSRSIEQATSWFELNWPKGLRWPRGIPGGPRTLPVRRRPAAAPAPKGTRTPAA